MSVDFCELTLCKLKQIYPEVFIGNVETSHGFFYVFLTNERYIRVSFNPILKEISSVLFVLFDKPISKRLMKNKKVNSNIALYNELYRNKIKHCAVAIDCMYEGVSIYERVITDINSKENICFSRHMFSDNVFHKTIIGFDEFVGNLSSENCKWVLKNISIVSTVENLNKQIFASID